MNLIVHPIWGAVEGAETFESFKNNFVFELNIGDNIPVDIRDRLYIIQKLLEHSYFEYGFIDIAFIQSIITLEKCLKFRYETVENKICDKNFYKLIIWFEEKKYFANNDKDIVDFLRTFRNEQVHESRFSSGGIVYFRMLKKIIKLITGIFDTV